MAIETHLVDHHDGEEDTERGKEHAIDVVRDSLTDGDAESVEDDLSDREEGRSKDDVSNGPPVVERTNDEHELEDNVDHDAGAIEDELDDPERDRVGGGERGEVLEGCDGDEARHKEDSEG